MADVTQLNEEVMHLLKQVAASVKRDEKKPSPECQLDFNAKMAGLADRITAVCTKIDSLVDLVSRMSTSLEAAARSLKDVEDDLREHETRLKAAEDYIAARKREQEKLNDNKSAIWWKAIWKVLEFILLIALGALVVKMGIKP